MIGWRLVCPSCGQDRRADARARRCRPCSVPLELHAEHHDLHPDPAATTLLGRYRAFLPPMGADALLTLGEGRTPLLESTAIGPLLRLERLAFMLESANPTGSWVDRGSVAFMQHAREAGARRVAVPAGGGLAPSAVVYAARAGLGATIVAADEAMGDPDGPSSGDAPASSDRRRAERPNGRLPAAWCEDAMRVPPAAARLVGVRARPAAVAAALRRAATATGIALMASDDAVWAAGLRTLAFELAEGVAAQARRDHVPDLVVIAEITGAEGPALAAGFRAWRRAGLATREPAVQVVGRGAASTPDGLVVDARDAGAARRLLAEEEGIVASPSSAAALASVVRLARAGLIAPDARVVVVLAAERAPRAASAADVPQLVGRVLRGVVPADLARVLSLPAF